MYTCCTTLVGHAYICTHALKVDFVDSPLVKYRLKGARFNRGKMWLSLKVRKPKKKAMQFKLLDRYWDTVMCELINAVSMINLLIFFIFLGVDTKHRSPR